MLWVLWVKNNGVSTAIIITEADTEATALKQFERGFGKKGANEIWEIQPINWISKGEVRTLLSLE